MVIKREGKKYVVYKGREVVFEGASVEHAQWFLEQVGFFDGVYEHRRHVDLFGEYDTVGVEQVRKENSFRNRQS